MNDEIPGREQTVPVTAEQGPGALLRAARERKQLSQHAVADALHLRLAVVDALERDDWQNLPPLTFTKGYLKAYAKLVEIPEYEVMDAFDQAHGAAAETPSEQRRPVAKPAAGGSGARLLWVLLLVIALLVALWLSRDWLEGRFAPAGGGDVEQAAESDARQVPQQEAPTEPAAAEPQPQAPVVDPVQPEPPQTLEPQQAPAPRQPEPQAEPEPFTAPDAVPEPEPLPEPEAEGMETARLTVILHGDSWMDVRDGAGRRLLLGLVEGPSTRVFEAPPPFSVVAGDAREVELMFNGEPVNLRPHTRGRVARVTLGEGS